MLDRSDASRFRQRLVKQEQFRFPRHRATDRDALTLAAGEFAWLMAEIIVEAQLGRNAGDALVDGGLRHPRHLEAEADVPLASMCG